MLAETKIATSQNESEEQRNMKLKDRRRVKNGREE